MSYKNGEFQPYLLEYDPIKNASIDGTDTVAHDRAVLRALRAAYRPGRAAARADPARCLFVGRLHPRTTQEVVRAEFAACGALAAVTLVRDAVTGRSRGYAFVEFAAAADAARALQLHDTEVDGAVVVVERARAAAAGWVPRRLGGGLGGRRSAGQLRFGGRARPFRRPLEAAPHPAPPSPPAEPTPTDDRRRGRTDTEPGRV